MKRNAFKHKMILFNPLLLVKVELNSGKNVLFSRTGELVRRETFAAHEWTGLYH